MSRDCGRVSPDALPALEQAFIEDDRAQLRGEPPRRQAVVSADPFVPAAYRTTEAIDFYQQPIPAGLWENEVTLRSTRAARLYEPGLWISRVAPTPLLLVVARDDKVTVADLALAAYERALQPKGLALIRAAISPLISTISTGGSRRNRLVSRASGQTRHRHSRR